jgi:hypothetical protein
MSALVFWVVTPCGLVGGYQRFGGRLPPEDEGDTYLRNVGNHLQEHSVTTQKTIMINSKIIFH